MPEPTVQSIVIGPPHHGVARHAVQIAALTNASIQRADQPTTAIGDTADVVHLHYTDRLFGTHPATAADAFVRWASTSSRPIVLSAHDLPTGDGTAYDDRRTRAYVRVVATAAEIVVASCHERHKVHRLGADATTIPLPIVDSPVAPLPGEPTVTVIGFVYPGKGHDDVIDACTMLHSPVKVVCAGAPSPGHDDLAAALARRAATVRPTITGALTDDELSTAIASATVPVVPARHPSASASLATWIAYGRRPLVATSPYSVELARTSPGLVTLYDPGRPDVLAAAIDTALSHPSSTWRTVAIPPSLRPAGVRAAHLAVFRRARWTGR